MPARGALGQFLFRVHSRVALVLVLDARIGIGTLIRLPTHTRDETHPRERGPTGDEPRQAALPEAHGESSIPQLWRGRLGVAVRESSPSWKDKNGRNDRLKLPSKV